MKKSKLDNKSLYQKLDPNQVGQSIEYLPDQIRQVLEDSQLIKIPRPYSKCTEVVINGMGGSNLGAYIVQDLFMDRLKVPLIIEPGYRVPEFVDKNTLFIISSYSGTTEEPLSVYQKVKKRNAKIMAISSKNPKSRLAKLMIKDNIPGYIFEPQLNPCKEPRIGLGYSIFGMAIMLAKAGLLEIKKSQVNNLIALLEIWTRKLRTASPVNQNLAKKMALNLHDKIPIIVAAEFLNGNLHAFRNQFNESSKFFSSFLSLPDLNHFAMEGLVNPKKNKSNLIFIFLDSHLYHPRIQKRSQLTKEVVKKNGIEVISHELKGKDKLTQSFEFLQFGTWVSYYLGILNNVNPKTIPYVDWFKKQLKK